MGKRAGYKTYLPRGREEVSKAKGCVERAMTSVTGALDVIEGDLGRSRHRAERAEPSLEEERDDD